MTVTDAKFYIPGLEHILLFFVDGLGIGEDDSAKNPFALRKSSFSHFVHEIFPKKIADSFYVTGLDANLDVPGLPQSATGQTALLTGINAAQILGRHLNARPNQRLREIIAEHSILKKMTEMGLKAAYLNAFRPPFFDFDPFAIIRHLSVTTVSNLYAGLPFFTVEDIMQEKAIYQDMTNDALVEKGFDTPIYTPEKAGQILAKQSQNYHFCLYEYFQTDFAGHSRDFSRAEKEIAKLTEFLDSLMQNINMSNTLVILTSDHGNVEDMSFKGHTRNPALTMIFGRGTETVLPHFHSILDVTPLVLNLARVNFLLQ